MVEDVFQPLARVDAALNEHELHVFRADLNRPAESPERLSRILSAEELRRANGYRFHRDRRRFIVRRALLRQLLARYARCDPSQIVLGTGRFGKPYLVRTSDVPPLRFSLSHSRDTAVFALTLGRAVGVDVESRVPLEYMPIAKRFFCPRELRVLMSAPASAQRGIFLQLWTCKEAALKAIGAGLSIPLTDVEVDLEHDAPLVDLPDADGQRQRAQCRPLSSAADGTCCSTVAVLGTTENLMCRQFSLHPAHGRQDSLLVACDLREQNLPL